MMADNQKRDASALIAGALAALLGGFVSPAAAQDWTPTVATVPGGTLLDPIPGAMNRAPTRIDPRYFPSPRSAVPPARQVPQAQRVPPAQQVPQALLVRAHRLQRPCSERSTGSVKQIVYASFFSSRINRVSWIQHLTGYELRYLLRVHHLLPAFYKNLSAKWQATK